MTLCIQPNTTNYTFVSGGFTDCTAYNTLCLHTHAVHKRNSTINGYKFEKRPEATEEGSEGRTDVQKMLCVQNK